ncbi:unnamed protein product [Withania somnifera]
MTIFEEPLPIQIEEPLSEKEIEDKATLWVQSNVLELSRRFRAAFEGIKKKEVIKKNGNLNNVPKELRNLEFHLNFKNGEPRETKLMGVGNALLKEVWHNRWMGEFHLDAVEKSSGGELIGMVGQMLTFTVFGIEQNLAWFLTIVYADCSKTIRRELWEELATIRNSCNGPWVLCGDFHVTRYPNERIDGHNITGAMTEFTDWINEMEIFSPPLFGGSYTWRREENHSTASRINRFLYFNLWEELFAQIRHCVLPGVGSDHYPIILSCGELNLRKTYVKFEKWWMAVEGFSEKVKEWWASFTVSVSASYVLASKLKLLKRRLKE